MPIALIIIYCLLAAFFIVGLTFHDELRKERERKPKGTLIAIDGGKHQVAKLRHRM
jgi:hypothetical protein